MIDRLDLKLNRYKRSMKPQRFIKFHFDHGKNYLKIYILTLKRPQNIHVSLFGNLLIYIDAIWWIGYIFFAISLPMMRRLRTWQLWGVQLRRPSYPLRMVIDIDQLAIRSLSGSIGDDRGLFWYILRRNSTALIQPIQICPIRPFNSMYVIYTNLRHHIFKVTS